MIRNLFSSVPFVLCALLAPDTGGSSGSAPAAPPEPSGNTLEEKLSSAKTIIGDFFKQLSGSFKERDDALAESKRAQGQFTAATKGWDDEKTAHAATTKELGTAKTNIIGLTAERDNANKNVERLESLCQLKGIDPNQVVKPAAQPASDSSAELREQYSQMTEDEKAGKIPTGSAHKFYRKNKAKIEKE